MTLYRLAVRTKTECDVVGDKFDLSEEEYNSAIAQLEKVLCSPNGYVSLDVHGSKVFIPIHSIDHMTLMEA